MCASVCPRSLYFQEQNACSCLSKKRPFVWKYTTWTFPLHRLFQFVWNLRDSKVKRPTLENVILLICPLPHSRMVNEARCKDTIKWEKKQIYLHFSVQQYLQPKAKDTILWEKNIFISVFCEDETCVFFYCQKEKFHFTTGKTQNLS